MGVLWPQNPDPRNIWSLGAFQLKQKYFVPLVEKKIACLAWVLPSETEKVERFRDGAVQRSTDVPDPPSIQNPDEKNENREQLG